MNKTRILPGIYFTLSMTFMGLFGLLSIYPNMVNGKPILAGFNLFMVLSFVKVLAFVELTPGRLTYVRIDRRSEFLVENIADLGIGFVRSKGLKWWFPVLRLATGEEIELRAVRSLSKRAIQKKCTTMAEALKYVDPALAAIATISVGPAEGFTPLPGLEEHWN